MMGFFNRRIVVLFCVLQFFTAIYFQKSFAQCVNPALYDVGLTTTSATPVWINCIDNPGSPNSFTLNLVSNHDIQSFSVDWGDASGITTGGIVLAGNTITSHTFTTLDSFKVSYTETIAGCTPKTITGKVINDRKTGASALPPTLGSSGCVPHAITFVNQSTNPSPNTRFTWDWGNTEKDVTTGTGSIGVPISHTYAKGKAGCNMTVKLTAQSMCATTFSSYGPFDFWDIDTARVTASATTLCSGDFVTFRDQSLYNCNISYPRRIRWSWLKPDNTFEYLSGTVANQYWVPATPANRTFIKFLSGNPGDKYIITLEDSNICGISPAAVTVRFVAPPTAAFNNTTPSICAGDTAKLNNTSTGSPGIIYINWGDNAAWDSYPGNTAKFIHRYTTPNTYTIKFAASIVGSNTCSDTTQQSIQVIPASISNFNVNTTEGCGSLTVNFTENSTNNPVSWDWDFGDGTTDTQTNPVSHVYTTPGTYFITLDTKNNLHCGIPLSRSVTVYPLLTANFTAAPQCIGDTTRFFDASTIVGIPCNVGNIKVERYDNIPGNTITDLTNAVNYPNNPTALFDLTSANFEILQSSPNKDNFGVRVRGFICPPTTGNYIFYINSDDYSELWLSPSGDPAIKNKIAFVNGNTGLNQWNVYTSQKSASIALTAGQSYYIEALMKEGAGGDHLQVAWELPGFFTRTLIPKARLSPFVDGNAITSWQWDFADGTTSTANNPKHKYAAPNTFNVSLTVSSGKCSTTVIKPVVVNPMPSVDFSLPSYQLCTPFVANLNNLSTGAATYTWDFGDGSPSSNAVTPTHTFNNVTNNNITYTISLTAFTAAGCNETADRIITVYPGPVAGFQYSPILPQCSPAQITFEEKAIVQLPATYDWDLGDGTTLQFLSSNPAYSSTFSHTYVNKTGAIQYDTVRMNVTSATGGCVGQTYKIVIVYPEPEFKIGAVPSEGCHPLNVNFFANGINSNYQWSFGDGSPLNATGNPAHTYLNNSSVDQFYKVMVSGKSLFGCSGKDSTIITVHPKPNADFNMTYLSQCSPVVVHFDNLSSADVVQHYWNFGDGNTNTFTSAAGFDYTYNNSTSGNQTYPPVLIVTNAAGCTDTLGKSILVYPQVTAKFVVNDTVGCSPIKLNFANASNNASAYSWNFGDFTGSVQPNPSKTYLEFNDVTDRNYSVSLTSRNPTTGCQDTYTKNINVFPKPDARFNIPPPFSGCSPFSANLQNSSTYFASNNYSWDFGDGTLVADNNASISHPYVNNNSVNSVNKIILYAQNSFGCKDTTAPQSVTVYPLVTADFTPTNTVGCSPLTSDFINLTTPGNVTGFSYVWDFNDASPNVFTKDAQHTFLNNNTGTDRNVNIALTSIAPAALGSCSNSVTKQVTIHSKPSITLTIPPADTVGCSPHPVTFSSFATPDVNAKFWSFGDGSTNLTNVSILPHTYTNTGNFSVVNTASVIGETNFGCKDTASVNIRVHPKVTAAFNPSSTAGCSPLTVNFLNLASPLVTVAQNSWDFNDGSFSSNQDVQHSFDNNTGVDIVKTVKLVSTSIYGCKDSTTHTITVYSKPFANYLILNPDVFGCNPFPVNFRNVSSGGYVSSSWSFGDGATDNTNSTTISHSYSNVSNSTKPFNYTLSVTSARGCTDDTTGTVYVYPYLDASFKPTDTIGCSPMNVGFQNFSVGSTNYNWDFGDATSSTDTIPSRTYYNYDPSNTNADKSFTIRLIAQSVFGCNDTLHKSIVVHPKPKVNFILDKSEGCTPLNITFQNTTQPAAYITTNTWKWGDGTQVVNNSVSIPHIYTNVSSDFDQYYTVKLISTNTYQCVDSIDRSIKIYPKVVAGFISTDTVGCSPYKVNFTNNSKAGIAFSWKFGPTGTSSDINPSYTFFNDAPSTTQRTDDIKLIAYSLNNCTDTAYKKVVVYPKPDSKFIATNTPGCSPLTVGFQNISVGATGSLWVFGDNDSSALANPVNHQYINATNNDISYNANLYVNNGFGCRDTSRQLVTIWPQSKSLFVPGSIAGCTPFANTFTNVSNNNFINSWNFGDGSFIDPRVNPDHIFYNNSKNDTTYTVKLAVSTTRGCSDTTSVNITVYARPIPQIVATPLEIIPEDSILYSNITQGNWSAYNWSFGDGGTSSAKDPGFHVYKLTGDYKVLLTVTSNHGCKDSTFENIRVREAKPDAIFHGSGKGCQTATITFYNDSYNSKDFTWDFGDGSPPIKTDNLAPIQHTYVNTSYIPKTFNITLKAQSPGGQVDYQTVTDSVLIYPNPDIYFEPRPALVYIPNADVLFVNNTQPTDGNTYVWDFGDGQSSDLPTPTHTYTTPANYNVTLKATTKDGCVSTKTINAVVSVKDGGIIKMPNAFTPSMNGSNGDEAGTGINDVFAPGYYSGLASYNLQIFNRWGELIFESNDANRGWDGYYRGKLCQEDVYVYKVKAKRADGDNKEMIGDITLLHK
jgi:gliding motility-associated-like protein